MRLSALTLIAPTLILMGCNAPPDPISAPTPAITPTIATPETLVGKALDGGGPVYRLMEDGSIRHIADLSTFFSLGYAPGEVTPTPMTELGGYPLAMPLTRWVTGQQDRKLYYLQNSKRYLIPDAESLRQTGGSPLDVSLYPDELLANLPIVSDTLPEAVPLAEASNPTAAVRQGGFIWAADDAGTLTRWEMLDGSRTPVPLPDGAMISALADGGDWLWVATRGGLLARIDADGWQTVTEGLGWVSALAADPEGGVWVASRDTYNFEAGYQDGQGLIHLSADGSRTRIDHPAELPAANPLGQIKTMAYDAENGWLWVGTNYAGLLRYNTANQNWRVFSFFTGDLPDTHVNDLTLANDGTLWIGSVEGVTSYRDKVFETIKAQDRRIKSNVLSVRATRNGDLWAAGERYISRLAPDQPLDTLTPFEDLAFNDRFIAVLLDDNDLPWLVGGRFLLHFNSVWWVAYDAATGERTEFQPDGLDDAPDAPSPDLPSPRDDYQAYIEAWPRPANDNGRCIHYLQTPSGDDYEVRQQIARLTRLHMRWVLVNYTTRSQLIEMAPRFQAAGITVIWRPFVRPYEVYPHWAEDVAILRAMGIAPYVQVYNEASIEQEWDGQPVDQATYLNNLIPAMRAVSDAGGYIGLQDISPEWTLATLARVRAEGMEDLYNRVFFVPHPYGANHPPGYDEDITAVLGFREYARIFEEELGFVPVMIAGEGGWRMGAADDTRYPQIDAALHRDYNVILFDWFNTGHLSNSEPLPDYLFAFCPWLLSDRNDPAAWYDSPVGDLTETIQGVSILPDDPRLFSWER